MDEINKGDLIEDFKQGSQELRRENPALKSYNVTIKSFTSLSKALLDLLPDDTKTKDGDALLDFIKGGPGARPK